MIKRAFLYPLKRTNYDFKKAEAAKVAVSEKVALFINFYRKC